ncbi:uncharacterized protein A1O5_06639 [Cladophialophora psammophila CBS 110553]|uniref:Uncharacterized protein n=1 Tax=Cladophialophora psammophila CBS 110553 TaxID=1182543 RepID=W9XJM8_9EURO|nr:uncharacterized protein A1O5_06639 [Cladophialophora psammophila CBS 110553]EXJ70569.1 hypothetical protein A1O5_06639 [Cladophialophora psammophila CBS 110553]
MVREACGREPWDGKNWKKCHLCAASCSLENDATFTLEADRVIEESFRARSPIYFHVPADTAGSWLMPAVSKTSQLECQTR